MKKKSSDEIQETHIRIIQEETFITPDGKYDTYVTVMSDGDDILIEIDFVEREDFIETSDDDYAGEYFS